MEYSVVGNTFQPVSLALKGAVRLSARAGAHAERCGLADRLHYSPTTRTLLLAANPGNKVLFWDKEEGMSISANEIHITFDPVTKKELIKGVGKVQFSLSQEESELLKKFFPIYKESHVSNR